MSGTDKKDPWMEGREYSRYSGLTHDQLYYRRRSRWIEGHHYKRTGPHEYSYHVENIEKFQWPPEKK